MVNSFFKSSKNFTEQDLLIELLKPIFVEATIEKIYNKNFDLNILNKNGESFLHQCISKNLTESVKWLISNGANIELENENNETAIFYAAHSNNKEILKTLINKGSNLEHKNIHQRIALQEAIISGNKNAIELLLDKTKNINNVDEHGRNLIYDAVSNGDMKMIKLISQNKDINMNQMDENGNTILHQKECLSNDEIAEALLEAGADPTITDKNGKNFLFYTATKGIESEHLIDKALSTGCDINSRSKNNQTVLMEVLMAFAKLSEIERQRRESLFKMVKKLISNGIDINAYDNDGETALFIAIRQKDIDTIQTLLSSEVIDLDHENKFGDTVLSLSCLYGIQYLDIILLLLNFGANPNVRDKDGKLLIEKLIFIINNINSDIDLDKEFLRYNISQEGNYFLVLKELLENSAVDLLTLNSKGKPFFFDAIFYKNLHLFKLLRKYGADLNQKDSNNHNILYNLMADAVKVYGFSEKEYLETLEQLIKIGIDINSRDSFGGITLHKAILENCEQTVSLLIKSRANMNAVDMKGRNIVHNCVWNGKVKHFKLLVKHNTDIMNKADKFGVLPINYAVFMGQTELVLEMISAGSFINNNHTKNKKMLEFLSQFNNNLEKIISEAGDNFNKKKLLMLIDNMRKEFIITDS